MNPQHTLKIFAWLLLFALLQGCEKEEELPAIHLSVDPSAITLSTNSTHQFTAHISGASDSTVQWQVAEGTAGGTINEAGLYKAPSVAGEYHIEVIAAADASKKAIATVTVTSAPVLSVAISPASAKLNIGEKLQLTASVSNSANKNVTWSVKQSGGGSVNASGQYTAPATAGVFQVMATSQADPSKVATSHITVVVPPNPERAKALQYYKDLYLASNVANIGWTGDNNGCNAGTTPQSVKDNVLKRIMYFRKMAGLNNTISMNEEQSKKCQQAAFMCRVNGRLDHNPPTTWTCYTAEGKEAAGKSNLAAKAGPNAINDYIHDYGSGNYFVGHRRWLLYPKLKQVGTGDTQSTNALWVVGNSGPAPADMPAFVAWPPKGYVPAPVVYPRWSFSIPGADFSGTTISMKDPEGKNLDVTIEKLNNGGYGDRTIVWLPSKLNLYSEADQKYEVTLKNVKANGTTKDYTYEVIIIKP